MRYDAPPAGVEVIISFYCSSVRCRNAPACFSRLPLAGYAFYIFSTTIFHYSNYSCMFSNNTYGYVKLLNDFHDILIFIRYFKR